MNQTPQSNQSAEHLDSNHLGPDTLSAFIDEELPPAQQQGIEHHLAICHGCTHRVLSATKLKSAIARAGQRFTPPPEGLAVLTAQLHSQSEPQAQAHSETQPKSTARLFSIRPAIVRHAAWAALAAAILLAVSLLGRRQLHQTNALAAELLDQHLASLSTAATPQVISTDRHTVKPWFQGRLPFSFNLPDATALQPDTTLKGADLTYLNGQPAALLFFTIHNHEVSVFLTQRNIGLTFAALPNTRAGFTLHTAATTDLRIVTVSDVNPADVDNLMAALVKAQASLQISK